MPLIFDAVKPGTIVGVSGAVVAAIVAWILFVEYRPR